LTAEAREAHRRLAFSSVFARAARKIRLELQAHPSLAYAVAPRRARGSVGQDAADRTRPSEPPDDGATTHHQTDGARSEYMGGLTV
jgi:hypothetical protein